MCDKGVQIQVGYRSASENLLIVVEKWMTWENVLDLGAGTGSALHYKYRMNLDRR